MTPRLWVLVVLVAAPDGTSASSPVPPAIAHPAVASPVTRTATIWRSGVGGFGEDLARADLASRGYEVRSVKLPSNQGIDLVVLKRGGGGRVIDARLVEVKTHYGAAGAKLSATKFGPQLSRRWLRDRLTRLRAAGSAGRALAREVYQFRKAAGVPIERLGEMHDLNLRSGVYTVRDPASQAVREVRPLREVLARLRDRPSNGDTARWARQHLAEYRILTESRMRNWVTAIQPRGQAVAAILRSGSRVLPATAVTVLPRAAGPVGLLVSASTDGYELYTLTIDYRHGTLSRRHYTIEVTRTIGGWAGASFGAWVGAKSGAYLGSTVGAFFFGPPAAAVGGVVVGVIGGGIGGVAGYFGGSYVSEQIVTTWYASLDREVAAGVTHWLIHGPCPIEAGAR